ncbi:MAG TPA: M23 family metallopeptidase [Candidatus Peribacteraceae bacterium]|nr:M23 family metallopeptidase [Candidatus Peribacteraceae bacterium]
MHTLNRFLTLILSVLVLIPPATFALVSLDSRTAAQQSLDQAINSAVHTYQARGAYQSIIDKKQVQQQQLSDRIAAVEKKEHDIRQEIVFQKKIIARISSTYHLTQTSTGQLATLIGSEKQRLFSLVRSAYLNQPLKRDATPSSVVVSAVMQATAGSNVLVSTESLEDVQIAYLHDLTDLQLAMQKQANLLAQRDSTLAQYNDLQQQYAQAGQAVEKSSAQLTQIQQITQDVHDQVLQLQNQLSRIDAELKSKAARALIQKGLLDPSTLQNSALTSSVPTFSWPAFGPIGAGFHDADYVKLFGVPHEGLDIDIPQGSPVYAASDGVVFLVRDGGATGYSYILIGHQDGYATLYGHVSKALVKAGDEVTAHQQIALSGGTPGMHGSGPMTTGPHLHFEVIKDGVNIDPKSVLP